MMKKLSQQLKQALTALAAADAGEMLTRRQMTRALHGHAGASAHSRRQVALWAGAKLSTEALDYALSACKRLDAALCVLHAQGIDIARLHQALGNSPARFVALSGRPEAALRQFLVAHSQVAFLVLDANDHAAHALAQRTGNLGVPMVAVTSGRPANQKLAPQQATPVVA